MSKPICIAGKNRIAVEALEFLNGFNSFALYICPSESDSGEDTWQPSLRNAARKLGVPEIPLNDCYEIQDLLFLSLEFDRIIKPSRFSKALPVNLHFSLLPAYKGCFTSIWPLYFGEELTGVTLHCIDSGIDTGDILDQDIIEINADVTARQLYEMYQDAGIELFKRNSLNLINGDLTSRRPQQSQGSTYFSRQSLTPDCFELNVKATAQQIKNQVRAIFFPEYQVISHLGSRFSACQITCSRSTREPGTVYEETEEYIKMATIDFDVFLVKWR